MLVEDAKLLNDLQNNLKNEILDIDVVANRFIELSSADDQITFDKVVQVLKENNIEFDRNLLSRWIKHSRTSSNSTCSIDKLTDILHRAVDPIFDEPSNDKNEIYDSHSNEEKTIFPVNKRIEHQSQSSFSDNGDIKTKYLEKLKHALYESLKQHAGKSIVLAIQLQDKGSLKRKVWIFTLIKS